MMRQSTVRPGGAGFPQGIMLLLPITMAVMGVSVLTPVVHLLLATLQERAQPRILGDGRCGDHAVDLGPADVGAGGLGGGSLRPPQGIDLSMVVYAFVGVAPVFLDNLYAIIVSRIGVGICEAVVMTVTTTMISDYFKGRTRERWLASQTAVASVAAIGITYLGGQLGATLAGAVPSIFTCIVCCWSWAS